MNLILNLQMVLSTMIQRVVCFIGLLLLYSKTPTAFSLLATSSSGILYLNFKS